MIVIANGERIACDKAVKDGDDILLLDASGKTVAEFIGVHDPTDYAIEGGEWSASAPTEQERRDAQIYYTAMMTDTLLPEEDEDDV